MGLRVLWKIIVIQHSLPLHQEMQLEVVLCKKNAFNNFVQRRCRVLWAHIHLKWTEIVHISACF